MVLTSFGKARRITERTAQRLPDPPDVLALDVNEPIQTDAAAKELDTRWGVLDGVVHAVAYAPSSCLGGAFLQAPWQDIATAFHVSTYSLVALSVGLAPLLRARGGGAIVGLDFDATVAWPSYDWMGVAKAGLESCARYLARDLGPDGWGSTSSLQTRSTPCRHAALRGSSISRRFGPPGHRSDGTPATPSPSRARWCMLLSDWARGISGEVAPSTAGRTLWGPAPVAERAVRGAR